MSLVLLPTVELEPSAWAEPGYERLIGTPQWEEFWERTLSRWQLRPVVAGAWQVSTESFDSEDALTRLLTLALQGAGVQGFPDQDGRVAPDEERVAALSGGYALFDTTDRAVVLPSCCCDLSDLGAWRRAASLADGEGIWLDMGHGNWSARRERTGVVLTETPETDGVEPVTAVVSADELLVATDVAERALEAFRRQLLPILHRLVEHGARADRLSCLMVGLPVE